MLNTTYIKGNAGIEYLRASEYYKDGQDRDVSPMVWLGKGLAGIGLTQGVAKDQDFVTVAKGFAPDGTALVQNAGDEERRIGMDWTFTAEKSMSEAMAMADPQLRDQIIAVQHRAVDKAMAFIEQFAEAHREKAGADVEKVQGIIAARVTHFTTRQAEDAVSVDPNLHCHVLVMNVAPREDGSFGAIDQAWMLDYKKAASALYRAECAQGMQELGFGITKVVQKDDRGQETGDIFYTLTGMTDEWRSAVSNRRKEILAHVAEHGTTTQQAALATRKKKDEPTFAECLDIWGKTNERLREQGIALSLDDWKGQPNQVAGIADQDALAKLTEQKAVFTRSELIERIALENVGIKGFDQCLADADRFTNHQHELGELHHIQPDKATHQWRLSGRHEELRMTSREFVTLERDALESAIVRRDDQAVRIAPELAHAAIARFEAKHGFTMGEEQRQAVEHVTSNSGGTCIIEGRAGTGKTTVSEAYVDAFRAAGRNVIGVAEGWDAATKLEAEAGITSHSSASLLQELRAGRMQLKSSDVLVVDEAGMVGTRNIRAFQKFCDEAGAKLILQGDAKQLQPISAGGIFRLIKQEVGAASLTEIRRQKDAKDLKTANLLYKDASLAFKGMDANGQVKAEATTKEAMGQLVRDYFANPSATRDKLVLVGTLGEGKRVTKMMRDELKERGTLHGTAYKFRALTGRWYDNIDVQCGDRLRFTKKDMALGVVNGTSGVVDKVDGRFITLRIESDIKAQDGRMVTVDTYKNRNFGHDWVRTVHKSQGQGKDAVFMLANPAMTDTHMGLVGFTRMKKDFALYGSTDDIKTFGKRLGVERLKENAIDKLVEPSAFELTKQKLAQQLELRRQRLEQEQQSEPKRKKQMQMER